MKLGRLIAQKLMAIVIIDKLIVPFEQNSEDKEIELSCPPPLIDDSRTGRTTWVGQVSIFKQSYILNFLWLIKVYSLIYR